MPRKVIVVESDLLSAKAVASVAQAVGAGLASLEWGAGAYGRGAWREVGADGLLKEMKRAIEWYETMRGTDAHTREHLAAVLGWLIIHGRAEGFW